MSTSIADLAVNISTNVASLETGMAKAADIVGRAANDMAKKVDGITGAFKTLAGAIGVGLSVAGIIELGKNITDAAEKLHNLSIETGSSVEELSRLSNIAKVSGGSVDTFRTLIDRLAAGMGGAEGKSTRVGEALKLLGVNASDPADALQKVANKLATFADGAAKAALARDLFGRNGVEFLTVLKAIAEQTDITGTKTTEQANKATDLAESFRLLNVQSHQLADTFFSELAPAITRVATAINEAAKLKGGLLGGLEIASGISVFSSIDENIASTEKQIDDLKQSIANVKAGAGGLWATIAPSSQDTSNLDKELANLGTRLKVLQQLKGQSLGNLDFLNQDRRPFAPQLPPKSTGGAADDPARKLMEAALATLKAYTEQEKAVLANSNQFLQAEYDRGAVSLSDYFTAKQAAQDEDLARTTDSYVKQITLIDNFIKHAATLKDRAQGEKEKVAATSAQTLAIIQAAGKSQQIIDEQDKLARDYGHTLDELNAKMLDLQGNTAAAAAIRFDAQNETFRKGLQSTIDSPTSTPAAVAAAKTAQERLATIEKNTVAQGALNDVTGKYTLILDKISVTQSRIDLAQQTGQITDLDAINQKAALAQASIGGLNAKLAEYAAIANDPTLKDGPLKADAILHVDQMRLQIDQLAASSDVLAGKFRDIFESGFSTFITDLTSGTKTVKTAFLDMGKSIEHSISDIAAKNISQSLFGEGGLLGKLSPGLASLFGGKGIGDASGAAALTGSAGALTSAAGALTAAATALGGSSAAGALGALSGPITTFGSSSFGADGAGIGFGVGPGLAGGTDFAAGGMTLVGERGPEVVNLPRGAQVIPNDALTAARNAKQQTTIHMPISVNVLPGASRASAEQAGAETGRAVQRALARIG